MKARRAWAAAAAAALLALGPRAAAACAVCYGAAGSPMVDGMNNAILVLLGIVALVQGGLVALFFAIRQRSRDLERRRGEFEVLQGGVR